MTILTTIPNGGNFKDIRDTLNNLLATVASLTAPTLKALTVSASSGTVGTALSSTITGLTSGSSVALSGAGAAGLSISGAVITGTPTTAGAVNIVETLAGATNTPRTTSGLITIVAASVTLPQASSIVGHWRVEDIAPVADSTAVATWTDRANGYQLVQPTGAVQPLYRTNRQGSFPTLQFNGSSQFMYATRASIPAFATAMANIATQMIIMRGVGVGSGEGIAVGWGTSGSNQSFIVANGVKAGGFNGSAPFTDVGFVSLARNSGGSALTSSGTHINGGQINGSSGNSDSSNNLGLMGRVQGGTTADNYCKGEVLAYVTWSTRLTPAEIMQADNYFRSVYGAANPRATLTRFNVFDGDSITAGQGAAETQYTAPYQAAAALGLTYGQWAMTAIPGISWDTMIAKAALDVDALTGPLAANMPLRLWAMEWYNQAGGTVGRNSGIGSTVAGKAQSYIAARMAANSNNRVALGTSTNSGVDNTNSNVERASFNNLCVSNYASWGAAALARVDLDANIGANGTSSNVTYFQSDQTHLTGVSTSPDGYEKLAAVMTTAFTGL